MLKRKGKQTNKRIWIIGVIIVLVIIIALTIFLNNNKKTEPDLIIGYTADSFSSSPIIIGKELGLFEKQGLIVEYMPFTSSKYIRQAISTGQANIVTSGANNFINPIAQGINIKFIAPMVQAPSYAFVRPNDVITLADMNNKIIASRIDATSGYALRRILEENDLDINYTFVDIDSEYTPIALVDKKVIDVALRSAESKEDFFKMGAIVLPEWDEKKYQERYFLSVSVVVDENFANAHPEVMNKFIDGYIASHKYIKEHPEEARKILKDYMYDVTIDVANYSIEDVKNTLAPLKFTLWIDPNEFLNIANYATETGIIDKTLTIDDIYDNRWEDKLKNAQEEIYGN